MAITNESDLIAALAGAQRFPIIKPTASAEGAAAYHSLWKVAGNPIAGANPPAFTAGSGYIPTKATTGAIPFVNPTGGDLSYLCRWSITGSVVGHITIYDRMWACSGLLTNTNTLQTVTTPGSLTAGRDPNTGADVEPWVEVYTAPGATGANWDIFGTDGAGNTGRNWRYVHPANAETANQMMPLIPGGTTPAAVLGCRQVTDFQCSVSSGTAGDVGITLLRRIADIPIMIANVGAVLDFFGLGGPQIFDDSCIAFMVTCSTTSTGNLGGLIHIGQT